jgi:hypothetical protein
LNSEVEPSVAIEVESDSDEDRGLNLDLPTRERERTITMPMIPNHLVPHDGVRKRRSTQVKSGTIEQRIPSRASKSKEPDMLSVSSKPSLLSHNAENLKKLAAALNDMRIVADKVDKHIDSFQQSGYGMSFLDDKFANNKKEPNRVVRGNTEVFKNHSQV